MEDQQDQGQRWLPMIPHMDITKGQVIATGGTLLVSAGADIAMHAGGGGMVVGLLATWFVARHSGDVLRLVHIPGQNAVQVRDITARVVESATSRAYEVDEEDDACKDQSPQAKLKRMFGLKTPPLLPATQPKDEPMDDIEAVLEQADKDLRTIADASMSPTCIFADHPALMLDLAPNFRPDVNVMVEEGVFCCGMKRSGKTSALARISEQLGRFPDVRQVVFDIEGDLQSLVTAWANGHVIDRNNWYSAEEILTQGLQIVVNLQSWDEPEEQGIVISTLVWDLIKFTSAQSPKARKPCAVFLDEAQHWIPQEQADYLSPATQKRLISAFSTLLAMGGKRGLPPFIFTQRIAQVQKSAISCGIQIFMRQSLDNDKDRCAKYVNAKVLEREGFASLGKGQAVVCWPGGAQVIVQFMDRDTEHLSHTPKVAISTAQPTRAIPEQRAYIPTRLPVMTARLPEIEPLQAIQPPAPVAPEKPVAAPTPQPARHFSQTELKRALHAYRAGHTSLRKLGEAIGKDKNYAASIKAELEHRKLI